MNYFIIVPHLFTICEWKLVILDGLDLCVYPTVAAMSSCEPQVWELRLVEDTPVLVEERGGTSINLNCVPDQVYNPPQPPSPPPIYSLKVWIENKMLIRAKCRNTGKQLFCFLKKSTELISFNVFPAERVLFLCNLFYC